MAFSPSGKQHRISFEDQYATIVEVGGGVRDYYVGQRAVLESYPMEAMCDGAHGAPLAPWPNRLADGSYTFRGVDYQVPLTEPEKNNAIHGLVRWLPWVVVHHAENAIVISNRVFPQPGYPFLLYIEIEYLLDESGLKVSACATNEGDQELPFGYGQHPYLSPGYGTIDDCTLMLGARTRVLTDNSRQLPTAVEPVEGTPFDFQFGKLLGKQRLDYPFTDLVRDDEHRAWARLIAPDGKCSALWVDEHFPYIEIYTGDTLSDARKRTGLGTEPMTCPPNAFQSGEDLIRIEPQHSVTVSWGARLE